MTPLIATVLDLGDFAIIAGIVLAAGLAVCSSRQSADLRRLERKLDAALKHLGVPPPPPMSVEVQNLARDPHQKIAAIRLLREETGLGLREAKLKVEEFMKSGR